VAGDRHTLLVYTLRNLIQSRRTSPYWKLNGQQGHLLLRSVAEAVTTAVECRRLCICLSLPARSIGDSTSN
jgi:hypothetical protein